MPCAGSAGTPRHGQQRRKELRHFGMTTPPLLNVLLYIFGHNHSILSYCSARKSLVAFLYFMKLFPDIT